MREKKNPDSVAPSERPASGGSGQEDCGSGLHAVPMGSVTLLVPWTDEAALWLREECESEPWQWRPFGGVAGLAVEPDAADEIMAAWEAR